MWSYYGAKTKIVGLYPAPKHDTIIEPFAGSAKYSLKYWDRDVTLIDSYDVIVNIWHYLQNCSPSDVLRLPRLKYGQSYNDFIFDCLPARHLTSFVHGAGDFSPRNRPSRRRTTDYPGYVEACFKRIADNLHKIRHWKILHGSYTDAPDMAATFFIDPPYQIGGHKYIKSNNALSFSELSGWCRTRKGQVIVCENTKADWLPFVPMKGIRGSNFNSTEAIWCNQATIYNNIQQTLF